MLVGRFKRLPYRRNVDICLCHESIPSPKVTPLDQGSRDISVCTGRYGKHAFTAGPALE